MTRERPSKRRHPVRKAFIGLMVCVALLSLSATAGVFFLQRKLTGQIDRIDGVFDGLQDRPRVPTSGHAAQAVNILVMGTDRRSPVGTTGGDAAAPTWVPGAQRTDTLMMVHIDGDRRGASVISLPRDAWVAVPGHGMDKVNAAFSYAGPALAVRTVEDLTGVRVDHLAVIDWDGFRQLTDAVGGVSVNVPSTVVDPARGITWTAGWHTLDGRRALDYVGQRYGLPGGDLDRVRRQQNFLRTLMEDSLHAEMRKSPMMVYDFLDIVTRHLSVDDELGDRRHGRPGPLAAQPPHGRHPLPHRPGPGSGSSGRPERGLSRPRAGEGTVGGGPRGPGRHLGGSPPGSRDRHAGQLTGQLNGAQLTACGVNSTETHPRRTT